MLYAEERRVGEKGERVSCMEGRGGGGYGDYGSIRVTMVGHFHLTSHAVM